MGRTIATSLASALLLAGASIAQGDVTRTGKTFAVTLHPGPLGEALAARLADETLAAAERVRPALDKLQLRPAKAPVIHLYADEKQYRALEAKHAKYTFRVESFVQHTAGCAHVLLWPMFDAVDLDFVGLPTPAAENVMRHAVELAALDRNPSLTGDLWRARVLAHGVVDELVNPEGKAGFDPMLDARRSVHANKLERGKAPKLRAWVEDLDVPADRDAFDYMEEARGLIAATLADGGSLRRLCASAIDLDKGVVAARVAAVEATLGKDWVKNEARFTKILKASAPQWQVVSPMVARRDGRLLLFGTQEAAVLAAVEPPPAGPYAIRATCELVPGWKDDLRVELDWDTETLLGCFLETDEVWVAQWQAAANKWGKVLASRKSPIQAGRPFELSIEVDTKIRIAIDGTQLMEVDYGKRSMRGPWAIAKNDGPVWVRDLRCEPPAPPKRK